MNVWRDAQHATDILESNNRRAATGRNPVDGIVAGETIAYQGEHIQRRQRD